MRRRSAALGVAAALATAIPHPGAAQGARGHLTATAAATITRVDPVPGDTAAMQAAVDLTAIMGVARFASGRVRVAATLNLEGLTMPDGVLTAGAFGEGYMDRRHPHTYVHELLATIAQPVTSQFAVSATLGKGFAAFGTDDPMNRPVLKYPLNHHWAQVLERAVATVGLRVSRAALEGSLFDGDEPERPWQAPNLSRFGDSWSVRASVWPVAGVEGQVSHAFVASPEHRDGAGPNASKWSASARLERAVGNGALYLFGEWARTTEADGFFAFSSVLGEGEWRARRHRVYARVERTDRPEEERTADPFRSIRPPIDDALLGVTRWTVLTAGIGVTATSVAGLVVEPVFEASRADVRGVSGLFDPATFYGGTVIWSVSGGVRLRWGPAHRMGRYGVLEPVASPDMDMHGMHAN